MKVYCEKPTKDWQKIWEYVKKHECLRINQQDPFVHNPMPKAKANDDGSILIYPETESIACGSTDTASIDLSYKPREITGDGNTDTPRGPIHYFTSGKPDLLEITCKGESLLRSTDSTIEAIQSILGDYLRGANIAVGPTAAKEKKIKTIIGLMDERKMVKIYDYRGNEIWVYEAYITQRKKNPTLPIIELELTMTGAPKLLTQ